MLLLTRNIGESIVIQNDIRIEVLGFNGAQVRIGIHAPLDIPVFRSELYEAKKPFRFHKHQKQ